VDLLGDVGRQPGASASAAVREYAWRASGEEMHGDEFGDGGLKSETQLSGGSK
jgi:hypothetical protein